MATITVTLNNALATELDETAVRHGFANSKAMLTRFIQSELKKYRMDKFEDSKVQSKKDIETAWAEDIKNITVL